MWCPGTRISALTGAFMLLAGCEVLAEAAFKGVFYGIAAGVEAMVDANRTEPATASVNRGALVGYCHDLRIETSYPIYSEGPEGGSCAEGSAPITKEDYETNIELQKRAYCAAASDGSLYRGTKDGCKEGDKQITLADYYKGSIGETELADALATKETRDAAQATQFKIGGRTVTPLVKAEIDRYANYCKAASSWYCVIAMRTDGSKTGFAKAPRGYQTRIEGLRRTAINSCGSAADCVIVYEDGLVRTAGVAP